MQVNNLNSGNVNFQARLSFIDNPKLLKPYETRLKNISKMFEENTTKYQDINLEFKQNKDMLDLTYNNDYKCWEKIGNFTPKGVEKFFKLKDESIVERLKSFLKLGFAKEKVNEERAKFTLMVDKLTGRTKDRYTSYARFCERQPVAFYTDNALAAMQQNLSNKYPILDNPKYFKFFNSNA